MADDLVKQALNSDEEAVDHTVDQEAAQLKQSMMTDDEEVNKSNELANTLNALQTLIEKHALELTRLNEELKTKRQSIKNVFDNDVQLSENQEEVERFNQQLKERKSQLQNDPQIISLKVDVADLNEQKKELEETLSNHLVNYHALTNSTSFDTSEGDQWEFSIKAKIKSKAKTKK